MALRRACVIALCAVVRSEPSGSTSSSSSSDAEYCDMCGNSASYSEALDTSGTYAKRTITTNGCPNHYAVCTGKGTGTCGDVGEEGTGTEALVQDYVFEIPANPILATATTDKECVTDSIAVALNGVPIYSGAVSADCDILDVDDEDAEWTSFDYCGGHGRCLADDCTGDYHYHFPASCLETQIGLLSDGHSPQIGWAFDGFPVYGPFGPGGVAMTHAAQGCTGDYCLDECSGLEMELSDVDDFKFRYYMNGPLSDLSTLPTSPKPATTDYPFALKCYKGCTYADLVAEDSKCTGGSTGVTSAYTATVTAGVTDVFVSEAAAAAGMLCADGTETEQATAVNRAHATVAPPQLLLGTVMVLLVALAWV